MKNKIVTEQLFGGIYIDDEGCGICYIDTYNHSDKGLIVKEEFFISEISLDKILNYLKTIEEQRYVVKYAINKPFDLKLINLYKTIEDVPLDVFNGLLYTKSLINDKKLSFEKNLELINSLKNFEKDSIDHRFFSLIIAIQGISNNMSTLNYWEAMVNNSFEKLKTY